MSHDAMGMQSRLAVARAVLFDLDGTLADTAPDLAGALNQMRLARGKLALPLDLLRPVASAGARGMLKVGLDLTPEHPQFDAARHEFLSNYAACLADRTCLFEGVDELLRALEARSIPWGIVTNKPERFTSPVLSGLGLASRCAVSISGDTTAHPKPHPEPLFEACRRLEIAPEQAVYVGDDLRDIQSARAAGMPSVAAAWGYLGDGPDIQAWQADVILQMPAELTALLLAGRP